jgi:surfeit locus 1 family protein
MSGSISFRPRLVPTAAALLGVLSTALLGDWQLNRAAYKAELEMRISQAGREPPISIARERIEPDPLLYHPVQVRGQFDPAGTVFIDNRVHHGAVGYWVVTPLKITGSERYVLVERGWVGARMDRTQPPNVATPGGEVEISGIALPGNPPVFELSQQVVAGKVWQNLTVDRYREHYAIDLQPVIVQQHNQLPDDLLRDWTPPTLGIDRHRAYAFQWFSLAVVILIVYIALNVRRKNIAA